MKAVLERDYASQAVKPRAFAARTAVGAYAVVALVLLALGGTAAGTDGDRIGRAAFRSTTAALLVFLCTTVPFLLAGSLLAERRARTLDLVLVSPEGARGVAAGKLLAGLGTTLGWTAAAVPPLTVAVLFGGTSWHTLVNSLLGLLAAAIQLAAWGLLAAAAARRLATAAVFAILLPLLHWWVGGLLLHEVPSGPAGLLFAATGPAPHLALEAWDQAVRARVPAAAAWIYRHPGLLHLLAAAAMAALAVPGAAALLSREEAAGSRSRVGVPRSRLDRRLRSWLTRGNPVAWKESLLLDTAWSRRLHHSLLLVLAAAEIAILVLVVRGDWDRSRDNVYLAVLCTGLAGLAAVQGASSVAFEKGRGSFDLLRATRLTPAQIARGMFAGTVLGLGLLLLFPLGHLAMTVLAEIHSPAAAGAGALFSLLLFANAVLHGTTWGIVARSPAAAIAGAASFVVFSAAGCAVLCVLPFLLLALRSIRPLAGRSFDTSEFLEIILVPAALCGSPLLVFARALEAFEEGGGRASGVPGLLAVAFASAAISVVYVLYRWHSLPGTLESELFRLAEGNPGPSAPSHAPPPPPLADRSSAAVRRLRGRRGERAP